MAAFKYIFFLFLFLAGQARADEGSRAALVLNGISRHQGSQPVCEPCNENNRGLGFEVITQKGEWPARFASGYFKNSLDFNSWYMGFAKTHRWGDRFAVEIGGFAGYVHYPTDPRTFEERVNGKRTRSDFLFLVPLIVFDLDYARINVLYLPAVTKDVASAWFVQLAVPLFR